jgi:hypothetical protein
MCLDNLIQILPVNIGIPGFIRINHYNWPFIATIQAASCIYADLPRTVYAKFLATLFDVVSSRLGIALTATLLAAFALIGTEKHVMLVIRHGCS